MNLRTAGELKIPGVLAGLPAVPVPFAKDSSNSLRPLNSALPSGLTCRNDMLTSSPHPLPLSSLDCGPALAAATRPSSPPSGVNCEHENS